MGVILFPNALIAYIKDTSRKFLVQICTESPWTNTLRYCLKAFSANDTLQSQFLKLLARDQVFLGSRNTALIIHVLPDQVMLKFYTDLYITFTQYDEIPLK